MLTRPLPLLLVLLLVLPSCGDEETTQTYGPKLEIVAESSRRWTGVAVSPEGRIFVNYPRWSDDVPISVAEIVDGESVPFPDGAWNAWEPGLDVTKRHVCVQSVTFDDQGVLWILDPGSPTSTSRWRRRRAT